ncbi:hypothetical protein DMN91_000970, partial [Ooceraea biroi]
MAQNPFATLKYAIEAVPFFDGSNISLSYFVEGCEEAKSMLPNEAESQFTKIVRTRVVGEARRTIQGQVFETIAQLTKYLKQIYGSSKNAYQLQGELGNIYQKIPDDFPISQAGILGNNFFVYTGSKIDYADGYLEMSDMKIPFFTSETIIVPPRSESAFYIRLQNLEVKIGYVPKITLTQGIHLGDTIADNVNGKAHLPIISTLDKEVEIRVPTLRMVPLNEYLDDLLADLSNEQSNKQKEEGNMETASIEDYDNGKQECFIKSSDNSLIEESDISGEGSFQTSPTDINYLGISEDYPPSIQYSCPVECDEGSYQFSLVTTSPIEEIKEGNIKRRKEINENKKLKENRNKEENNSSREGSFQTSPKDIDYLGIGEDYPPSIQYFCPVECNEGSYQTSLVTTSSIAENKEEKINKEDNKKEKVIKERKEIYGNEELKENKNIEPDKTSEIRKRKNKDGEVT